jgi:uncharacterized glyoxalase superfamily protein PhnB
MVRGRYRARYAEPLSNAQVRRRPRRDRFPRAGLRLRAHAVHETDDGAVAHAELRLGDDYVMLGATSAGEERFNQSAGHTSVYVVVDDPDAVHDRAKDAGATIERELTDQDYGSREFTARDPEGNLWSFGTYRPSP